MPIVNADDLEILGAAAQAQTKMIDILLGRIFASAETEDSKRAALQDVARAAHISPQQLALSSMVNSREPKRSRRAAWLAFCGYTKAKSPQS